MKIRELLRSDTIYIPELYYAWDKEQQESKTFVPYPTREGLVRDYSFYLLERLRQKDLIEDAGGNYNWRMFVGIPQGNVTKGFVEAQIEQRLFGGPKIVCRILNFFVEPKSRNLNLGKLLLEEVEKFGRMYGAQAFEVAYAPKSEAHAFWLKLGVKTFSMTGVFADANWVPKTEEIAKWASGLTQEKQQIGSLEVPIKATQESSEIQDKVKEPLTLVKG